MTRIVTGLWQDPKTRSLSGTLQLGETVYKVYIDETGEKRSPTSPDFQLALRPRDPHSRPSD